MYETTLFFELYLLIIFFSFKAFSNISNLSKDELQNLLREHITFTKLLTDSAKRIRPASIMFESGSLWHAEELNAIYELMHLSRILGVEKVNSLGLPGSR
jgi:hypothetical protein